MFILSKQPSKKFRFLLPALLPSPLSIRHALRREGAARRRRKQQKNCRFIQENNKKACETVKPFSRCNKVEERQTVGKCAKVKKRNCRKVPYWLWASFSSLWSGKLILNDGWDVSGQMVLKVLRKFKAKHIEFEINYKNKIKHRYRQPINKHNRTEIRTHCNIFVNFCL